MNILTYDVQCNYLQLPKFERFDTIPDNERARVEELNLFRKAFNVLKHQINFEVSELLCKGNTLKEIIQI